MCIRDSSYILKTTAKIRIYHHCFVYIFTRKLAKFASAHLIPEIDQGNKTASRCVHTGWKLELGIRGKWWENFREEIEKERVGRFGSTNRPSGSGRLALREREVMQTGQPPTYQSTLWNQWSAITASDICMDRHQLIRGTRHGFRKGRSCTTNILEFLDMVTDVFNHKGSVDVTLPWQC